MLEGIEASSYRMDRRSWAAAVDDKNNDAEAAWSKRCLFSELDTDRTVKCGCDVYMRLDRPSSTCREVNQNGFTLDRGTDQLFDVCTESGEWIYAPLDNPQHNGSALLSDTQMVKALSDFVDCHLVRTLSSVTPGYDTICGCEDADRFEQRSRNGKSIIRACQWINSNAMCNHFGGYMTCGEC